MKLAIRQADGTEKLIDVKGSGLKVPVTPGASYRPLNEQTAKTPKTAVLKRQHDDLLIQSGHDDSAVTLQGFFSDCTPTDRCSAVLDAAQGDGAIVTITQSDGAPLGSLLGGQSGAMFDGQTLAFGSAAQGDGAAAAAAAGGGNMLWLGAGGLLLAAAAGGGGGGGGSGGGVSTGTGTGTGGGTGGGTGTGTGGGGTVTTLAAGDLHIKGTVAAGPMKTGTVEVLAYDKDGQLLGRALISADNGGYEITIPGKLGYTGPVLLVARDVDPNAATNFISEATGQWTNLATSLGAVGVSPGNLATLVINITPLTHLATLKLGVDVDAATPATPAGVDAAKIAMVNDAVGKFLGVADILGTPVTINDPGFRASAGTDGWAYGVALAKLAVLDTQSGGVGATLAHLNTVLTIASDGSFTNSDPALAHIATSRTIASDYNRAASDAAEAAQGHAVVNLARQAGDRVEVALPVNAIAGDIAHLTLTGPHGTFAAGDYVLTAADILAGFAQLPVSLSALAHAGTGEIWPHVVFTDASGANASAMVTDDAFHADVIAPQPTLSTLAVAAGAGHAAGLDVIVSYQTMSEGDTVQITWDGVALGAPHVITAADLAAGGYTIFVPSLAMGKAGGVFGASVIDVAGNGGDSSMSVAPSVPTQHAVIGAITELTIDHGSVAGPIASGTSTDGRTPIITGTLDAPLEAGQVLTIYDNHDGVTTAIGTAVVNGTSWSFAPASLAIGSHSFSAAVYDVDIRAAGPSSASFAINEQSISIDGAVDARGATQGAIAANGITDDNLPTLVGSLGNATLGAGEAVVIYDGAVRLGTATVSGTGWSFTPGIALGDGAHSLVAMIEDATTGTATTGRVVSAPLDFTIAATQLAPSVLATIDTVSENTSINGSLVGTVLNGTSTDGAAPLLSGSLSATLGSNEVLAVYDGAQRLGTASVSGTGWTFTPNALALGGHSLTVVVENGVSGLQGTVSAPFLLHGQTVSITGVADTVGALQGNVLGSGFTDDARPTITGTLGAAGLGTNEVVAVYDGSTKLGSATVSGTSWSFTPSGALGDGTHTLTAMVQDAASTSALAGRSVSTPNHLTVDTIGLAPTQTVTVDSAVDDNAHNGSSVGPLTTGISTDDQTPQLHGTLSSVLAGGQVVAIYDQIGPDNIRMGTATVSGTQWSFDFAQPLPVGMHTFTAVAENAASGAQGVASSAFVVFEERVALVAMTDDVGNLQAAISNHGLTDDTRPTWTGTVGGNGLHGGEVVAIYDGNVKIGEATVTGGNWSFTPGTALADGAHSLRAMLQDPTTGTATNGRVVSDTFDFTVMTNVPAPTTVVTISQVSENTGPATGAFASGTSTDGRTPTLTGTLSAPLAQGEVLTISDGTTVLGQATVNGTSWSFTTPTLAIGSHSLTAAVQNIVSATTGPVSAPFVVNEQAIAALGVYDDVGSVQGQVAPNASTDDTRPTFSGSLGSATLGAGEVVAVYDGATRIGVATLSGAAWSFTPVAALADGSHQLSAMIQDAGSSDPATGRLVTSTFAFTVDTSGLAPTQTAAINAGVDANAANGSMVGSFGNGASTDDRAPGLTGSVSAPLTASQVVAVYDGGVRVGTATVSGTTWTFTNATLGVGSHSFTAVVESSVSGAQGTPSAAFVVNEQSIAISAINDDVGVLQGNLLSGSLLALGATDDNRPTLQGTLGQATLGAGEVVAIYDGATKLGNAVVSGTAWSFTPGVALADGAHSLRAMVQDGTTGTAISGRVVSATNDLVVLSVLNAPGTHATIGSVSENTATNGSAIGNIASGTSTDGRTPTVSGTLDAALNLGDSVAIYDGATRLGTATVNGSSWTYTTPTLAYGSHSLTAVVENAVTGLAGTPSAAFTFVEQAVSVTGLIDDVGASTGAIAANAATDDARPTFNGTLASATLGSNEVVAIYDGANKIGVATVTGTAWTFTPGSDLSNATHNLRAIVQDAGSTNAANGRAIGATASFTVDTSAVVPTQLATITGATEATTSNGSVSGSFASGTSTDGRTPTLSGTINSGLTAGQVVAIYDGATRLGTATVNGTSWSYATPSLATGSHSLTAQVENAATGASAPASAAFQVIEQSVAVDNSMLVGLLPVGVNLGVQAAVNGLLNVNYTPAFTGTLGSTTLGANETVALYDGTTKLGEATVTGSTWSFTPPAAMGTGLHSVVAMIQPTGVSNASAGRVVSAPSDFRIDLNIAVPTQLVTISAATENVATNGSVTGAIGNGNSTDATAPTLSGTLSGPLVGAQVLAVFDGLTKIGEATVNGTSWSYTPATPLALGSHTFTAQVQNPLSLLNGIAAVGYTVQVQTIGNLSVSDNVGAIQGAITAGGVTDDTTPTLTGTIGSAGVGLTEAVVVYDTVNGVTTQLGTATLIGTNWSFTPLLPMAAGAHHLTAMIENTPLLGGTATTGRVVSGAVDFTIDNSPAPTQLVGISTVTDANGLGGSRTGALNSGSVIDDGRPVIAGTLSAALSGAQAVAVYDTVGVTRTKVGYATVDAGNSLHWTFTPDAALGAGLHTLSAQVENTATGSNGLASLPFLVTERPVTLAIGDNSGSVQGDVLGFGNATTDDHTLALSGTIGSALVLETVKVYDNGALLGTATVNGTNWSFNTATLGNGSHSFAVHVENALGNFTVANGATVTVANADPLVTTADSHYTGQALARFDVHGNATQLDLTQVAGAQQPHMDVVTLGSAANALKIGYADVLQGSTDSFTSANGWAGLAASGRSQLLVTGDSGTVTMTDSTWSAAGTVTHDGTVYNVYNDTLHNAQLLVDAHLSRTGPISG